MSTWSPNRRFAAPPAGGLTAPHRCARASLNLPRPVVSKTLTTDKTRLGPFTSLAGAHVEFLGRISINHPIITRSFRQFDQALTVSDDLPCGHDNMLECGSISYAPGAEKSRS